MAKIKKPSKIVVLKRPEFEGIVQELSGAVYSPSALGAMFEFLYFEGDQPIMIKCDDTSDNTRGK
jgi:hypothetical protein